MKYIATQILIMLVGITLLYYFSTLANFSPYLPDRTPDWQRIGTFFSILFFLLQSVIGITIYFAQKFFAYGWKEFPPTGFAIKWGIMIAFVVILVAFLHIIHAISFFWGVVVAVAILMIIMLI